uniref:uncharacterized protein LOC108949452 isoform X2 n=1 Tax=Ciona intestinalis TaxID=7719 RepID=UPI00089DB3A6|nr:uncharacterized protein LOC108949452 isoform X2 [Ciona intestinalis]|eukprot:XP_018667233.1 uncharacterized protein LOC108949452 isoform X2 [Ciona intestinalis]
MVVSTTEFLDWAKTILDRLQDTLVVLGRNFKMFRLKETLFFGFMIGNLLKLGDCQTTCYCSGLQQTWAPSDAISSWSRCVGNARGLRNCYNAERSRRRSCMVNSTTMAVCMERKSCYDESSCTGQWSVWGAQTPCSTNCGRGTQTLARSCYKSGSHNLLAYNCAGGNGSSEERRTQSCTRRRCAPGMTFSVQTTTQTTMPTITRKTKTVVLPPTFVILATNAVRQNVSTPSAQEETTTVTKSKPTGTAVNITLLAAVLGSVALLCFALIAIVIICRLRKPKQRDCSAAGEPVTLTEGAGYESVSTVPLNYRSLPEQPNYSEIAPVQNRSDGIAHTGVSLTVKNTLYHSVGENEEISTQNPNGLYLQPLPSPGAQSTSEENAYFTIGYQQP